MFSSTAKDQLLGLKFWTSYSHQKPIVMSKCLDKITLKNQSGVWEPIGHHNVGQHSALLHCLQLRHKESGDHHSWILFMLYIKERRVTLGSSYIKQKPSHWYVHLTSVHEYIVYTFNHILFSAVCVSFPSSSFILVLVNLNHKILLNLASSTLNLNFMYPRECVNVGSSNFT